MGRDFANRFVLLATFAAAAWAHHSFAAEYDTRKPVHLNGTITRFDFMNPHAIIYLDDGTADWRIEASSPGVLTRHGVTPRSFQAGMHVVIEGYRARDGSHRVYGVALKSPDGHQFELNPQRERPDSQPETGQLRH